MKPLIFIEQTLKNEREHLRQLFKVAEIGIFGSFVRGEQTVESDVDILVDFCGEVSLFDLVDLEDYLTEKLGIKVDLVVKGALKPRIGEQVLKEVIYL